MLHYVRGDGGMVVNKAGAVMNLREIYIDGDVAYVTLTQGLKAIIDAADIPLVYGKNWYASRNKGLVYARRKVLGSNGKWITVHMHRVIINAPKGFEVDHANRNSLDNRRINLRLATRSQNMCNTTKRPGTMSKYKGIIWDSRKRKWRALISVNGKNKYLGRFKSQELAHAAYAKASKELHGEFGRTE